MIKTKKKDIEKLISSEVIAKQLDKLKISKEEITRQYNLLINGINYLSIDRPCTINDGIIKISGEKFDYYNNLHYEAIKNNRAMKFVPASGLATRMFKSLLAVYNDNNKLDIISNNLPTNDYDIINTKEFFSSINKFAFYGKFINLLSNKGFEFNTLLMQGNYKLLLELFLTDKGLNYSNLPKALIEFHIEKGETTTPLFSHLIELIEYCTEVFNIGKIHFTVSEEHYKIFENELHGLSSKLKNINIKIDYSLSVQNTSFDTISIDDNNNIVLEQNGKLFFRKGGHGALINNLNELNGDIIFIKNIDNVVPIDKLYDTTQYKILLCGLLVDIQNKVFSLLNSIENKIINEEDFYHSLNEIKNIIYLPEKTLQSFEDVKNYYFNILNRPLRVCGMVKNEGEPGGGPFWVKDENNNLSLQIVEANQIIPNQKEVFNTATHFNPVDLVCGVRDFKGNNFNLQKFVKHSTSFISEKTKDGKIIKVLELPGLWNGSMFYWNTVFVEVPSSTFNPVKSVFDLLRPAHSIVV